MTVFILILTFWAGHGAAMTQVYGFENMDKCKVAGEAWKKQNNGSLVAANYLCVETHR